MIKIPLTLIYWYNEETKLYEQVGTHHTITITEYEALEKALAKEDTIFALIAGFSVLLTIIFFILLFTGVIKL